MKTINNIEDIVSSTQENFGNGPDSIMFNHLKPGDNIEITWSGGLRSCVDVGYCFALPGMDVECDGMFIHIPKPDNPGGVDTPPEVFMHLADLADNQWLKKIRVL